MSLERRLYRCDGCGRPWRSREQRRMCEDYHEFEGGRNE